ncbi:MAG: DUF1573 domain-containing protein [Planctomycetota bacterium]|nr:DUF1573 domain-containing protein [Planctomycetota bacterium]
MKWKHIVPAIVLVAAVTILVRLGSVRQPSENSIPPATTILPSPDRPIEDNSSKVFDAEVHHFGRVMEGEIIPHIFGYTNHGTEVMEILDIETTCGCTVAGDYTRTVAPGERGEIPIILDTAGLIGSLEKKIKITTNQEPEHYELSMKGEVWQPWSLEPAQAMLGIIKDPNDGPSTILKLLKKSEGMLNVTKVEASSKTFSANIETVTPGREFKITVTAHPPYISGANSGKIRIETDDPTKKETVVEAYLFLEAAVEASPQHIKLPPAPLAKPTKKQVFVTCNDDSKIELGDISVSPEGVTYEVFENLPGKQFRITFTFPEGLSVERGDVRIKTSHTEFKELILPITHFK